MHIAMNQVADREAYALGETENQAVENLRAFLDEERVPEDERNIWRGPIGLDAPLSGDVLEQAPRH